MGWHIHEKDIEILDFWEGTGTVLDEDNGRTVVYPGDIRICQMGKGHEVQNTGSVALRYMAFVCYPDGKPE